MSLKVREAEEADFPALNHAVGVVALEKKFLSMTQPASLAQSLGYYQGILKAGFPNFVALDAQMVVGWCDIAPHFGGSVAHVGTLGIGLLSNYRGKGLGRQLMSAAIAKAWGIGLRRIELSVRADNLNAVHLYQDLGFEIEGLKRRGFCVDGEFIDVTIMGLLKP